MLLSNYFWIKMSNLGLKIKNTQFKIQKHKIT